MRKKRITIGMLSMMMAVSSVFGGVNISAATPKITANQVYDKGKNNLDHRRNHYNWNGQWNN